MTRFVKLFPATLIAAGALGLYLAAVPAMAVVIDCETVPDASIQAALNDGQTEIVINGRCEENVTVLKDGTSFSGFDQLGVHAIAGEVIMGNGTFFST